MFAVAVQFVEMGGRYVQLKWSGLGTTPVSVVQ